MRLSIIIPVFNVEQYIAKCLDSILGQDLLESDYEIIIVNDGSTDSSLKSVQNYAQKHRNIVIIDRSNQGVGSARNCGMDAAKGTYIYFLDADDYVLPKTLNKLIDTCCQYELEILTFISHNFSHSSSNKRTSGPSVNHNLAVGGEKLGAITTGQDYVAKVNYRVEVWWFLINREFLKNSEIRFSEDRWLEDAIFSLQLFLMAKRMAQLPMDAHRHRITSGTIMTTKAPAHYLKIIKDIQNVAITFDFIMKTLKQNKANPACVSRIRAKQQSLVFFSMVRMLKSTMSFEEVKQRVNEMNSINAYPLDSFLGKEYDKISYHFLISLFNNKARYYVLFKIVNPLLKLRHKLSNSV